MGFFKAKPFDIPSFLMLSLTASWVKMPWLVRVVLCVFGEYADGLGNRANIHPDFHEDYRTSLIILLYLAKIQQVQKLRGRGIRVIRDK